MRMMRRRFLHLASAAAVLPAVSRVASAQTAPGGGPKLTQVLRADFTGQEQKVQESVVSSLRWAQRRAWHMHPGAQELLFVYDGELTSRSRDKAARSSRPAKSA